MAVSHIQKVQIFNQLKEQVSAQKAILLITTKETQTTVNAKVNFEIRSQAYKNGVNLQVVKNTLIQKAFDTVPKLSGQTYLAYLQDKENSDEITVPKIVVGLLSKDFKDNFNVLGAIVNGEFYDSAMTLALSKTPSLKDSMGMVAGSLNQITTKLAIAIKEIPSSLARSIGEIQKQKV